LILISCRQENKESDITRSPGSLLPLADPACVLSATQSRSVRIWGSSMSRISLLAVSFFVFLPLARADDNPSWSPQAAANYLDQRANEWQNWSNAARGQGTVCISCHTALPLVLARPALERRLNETSAGRSEEAWLANVTKRVENWDKIVAQPGA